MDDSSPPPPAAGPVTMLLGEARKGDPQAVERLIALLYDDLRALARRQLGHEYQARTLEPTALVHEAYLKLIGGAGIAATDRAHLLAIAARAMRQVLIDHARRRTAAKREDAWNVVTLSEAGATETASPDELLALDHALRRLEPRQQQIVECRYFAGMTEAEIAKALGVTERTVRREWVRARARLHRDIYGLDCAPGW